MKQIRSILFLTYHFPPEVGGIQTRIAHYIEELRKRNIWVTVLAVTTRSDGTPEANVAGGEVITCPGGANNLLTCMRSLVIANLRKRFDVVHVFTGGSTLFGVSALVLGRISRVPAVVSFFGKEDFVFFSPLSKLLFKLALSLATRIDVNTSYTQGLVPEEFRSKTFVLSGGAEEVSTRTVPTPKKSGLRILFVGRLARRKGVDDLIKALATVRQVVPDCRLIIVGDGQDRKRLVSIVKSLGLSEFVDFKGTLLGKALHEEYELSDVVALPSKHDPTDTATEGLGLTLVEASMHGKPLVGTLHGGIPEVVRHGENGLLVPEGNPAALARAIEEVLTDADMAHRMGEAALRIARTRFNWNKATDVLLESYA